MMEISAQVRKCAKCGTLEKIDHGCPKRKRGQGRSVTVASHPHSWLKGASLKNLASAGPGRRAARGRHWLDLFWVLALSGLVLVGCPSKALAHVVGGIPDLPPRIFRPQGPATEGQQLRFDHLAAEDGLLHEVVYAVLQDHQGFMWFGTWNGLNRYNGYELEAFQHDPEDPTSLSSNIVLALYEDLAGTLWVGTEGGLNRLDRDTGRFTRYEHDPEDPTSLSSNVVGAIREDRRGNLWVATWDAGLNRMDRETGRFVRYLPDSGKPGGIGSEVVYGIWEDAQGFLWLATWDGVDRLDPASGRCIHYGHDQSDPDSLASDRTRAIRDLCLG